MFRNMPITARDAKKTEITVHTYDPTERPNDHHRAHLRCLAPINTGARGAIHPPHYV